jgi:AraC-like DNA-binding protein
MHGQITESPTPFLTNYFSEHQYLTPHLAEAMVVSLIRFLQSVSDDKFKPSKICFTHQAKTDIAEYERVFKCQVEFNDKQFKLYFEPQILSYRSPYAEPELLSMHMQSAEQHMEQLEKRDLILEVRSQVGALLESGDISLETISVQLDISPRQLRHQLNLAGTSLQRIINQYRKSLSRQLLSQTDETIAEIVYLTGFSEPSTFYRAFKRWEGMTPIEFRHLNNHDV